MSASTPTVRLVSVELSGEQEVVLARQRARQLAMALGFEPQLQTNIATALSEIARNAFQYAGGGRVDFSVATERGPAGPRQTFVIEVSDRGPGIADLEAVLGGTYRSSTGLGLGITGARRLMDRVELATSPHGTTVTLQQRLPAPLLARTPAQLQGVVDRLTQAAPASPLAEMQAHNQSLLRAMEEARLREEELARVNQELASTNSGVMALYDELDTLHRIAVTLASKLELKPLIQSIIDVTTALTNAEVGAFFFFHCEGEGWALYAQAGPKAAALEGFPSHPDPDFFGPDFATAGLVHLPELEPHAESCSRSGFAEALAGKLTVRSCLTVPVVDPAGAVLGALVFASEAPRTFSERSERILESVATQAVVGIEKARLFQSVTAANEAKDQFLAMLSHELRTPLNPVMAIVSALQDDARLPEDLREDLTVVWRNVRLEARLIDDLLDFNRLLKGKLRLSLETLEMHELIRSVLRICRGDFEEKRHELEMRFRADHTTVRGDSARLQQVLWNVLKNAIKFTPAAGRVMVETENVESILRIRVIDTGRGIDPAALQSIFTAFDQGESQVAQFGGLGLGLSIARMFVELHGGSIAAQSEGPGRGACLTISLPLSEDPARPAPPLPSPGPLFAPMATGPILLVDDHADTLRTLDRLLRRRGYEVLTAATGAEARRQAESGPVALLISDIGLPDGSGLDLLGALREKQHFPAIALSGYGMEGDLVASREAGFQAHLTKPVDFQELLRQVEALLGSGEPARES